MTMRATRHCKIRATCLRGSGPYSVVKDRPTKTAMVKSEFALTRSSRAVT